MDGRLRDDWDYFSFHGDDLRDEEEMAYDLDEEETETELSSSFVTSSRFNRFPPNKQSDDAAATADNGPRATPLVQHCVPWTNDPACLRGGRSLRCAPGFKTQKCFYCRVDEAFDRRTFECIPRSGGGSDGGEVKHCFRWHPNAPCRKGARAGFCIRGWEEKCIRCRSGEGVNTRTGECEGRSKNEGGGGSVDNSDGKVERCFRWHPSAACRAGGRAGKCIQGWEKKCIRCRRNEVANRTGECVPLRE